MASFSNLKAELEKLEAKRAELRAELIVVEAGIGSIRKLIQRRQLSMDTERFFNAKAEPVETPSEDLASAVKGERGGGDDEVVKDVVPKAEVEGGGQNEIDEPMSTVKEEPEEPDDTDVPELSTDDEHIQFQEESDFKRFKKVSSLPAHACRACFRLSRGMTEGQHKRVKGGCLKWDTQPARGRPCKPKAK